MLSEILPQFYFLYLRKGLLRGRASLCTIEHSVFCISVFLYFCISVFLYLRRGLLRGRARLCTIGHSTFPPILRSSQNYFWTGIVEQDNVEWKYDFVKIYNLIWVHFPSVDYHFKPRLAPTNLKLDIHQS